jgi:signal peptidase I
MLSHARHVRHMREDLIREADLKKLADKEEALKTALRSSNYETVERASDDLYTLVSKLAPTRTFSSVRENIEMLAVAIAVAMGFRTYFLQPFKIPTGSMQPTLFGIHSIARVQSTLLDRAPLKLVKWIITGEWYREVRVTNAGQLIIPEHSSQDDDPGFYTVYVENVRYKVPKDAKLNFRSSDYVRPGDMLWSGIVTAGDHVFVNKLKWNFQRPRRGEVMVFSTDGITELPPHTHYIKRMSGLPNESISINPPCLLVNNTNVVEPRAIARIANKEPRYAGYTLAAGASGLLRQPSDVIHLGNGQYLALGDNTLNSADGRYWGAVPEENLVGPAMFTYWPFGERWGPIQ